MTVAQTLANASICKFLPLPPPPPVMGTVAQPLANASVKRSNQGRRRHCRIGRQGGTGWVLDIRFPVLLNKVVSLDSPMLPFVLKLVLPSKVLNNLNLGISVLVRAKQFTTGVQLGLPLGAALCAQQGATGAQFGLYLVASCAQFVLLTKEQMALAVQGRKQGQGIPGSCVSPPLGRHNNIHNHVTMRSL
eukprot:3995262-Amphidinium_carterae.1